MNLRGRLGHIVDWNRSPTRVPKRQEARRRSGTRSSLGLGAVALDLPEATTGDQGLLGQTGDLEVPTGCDSEVLSEGPVLCEDPGLGVPGQVTDAIFFLPATHEA